MTTATLLGLLLKVTVILVLALVGARLMRHSRAAVRHVMLAAAFIVVMVLPIASLVGPTIQIAMPAAVQEAIALPDINPIVPETTVATSAANLVARQEQSLQARFTWSAALLGLWLAGSIVFISPLAIGLWRVRSLRRTALPWNEGGEVVAGFAAGSGIARRIDVLLHESLAGPMTCGVFRPAVVLPIDARTWAPEDLRRAIVHELEHVRRGDWACQVLARIAASMYWFHPIVWVASRQLALEAERACDDAVLGEEAGSSVAYADQLVHLAERLSTSSSRPQLAMANRSDLATRVVAVLDHHQARGRAGAQWVAVASIASAILIVAVSPLRLVAGAQTQASSAPTTRLTYDAATIKRCEVEPNPTGARGTAGGTNATASPGRFFVPCVTTEQLIYLAYASYGAPEQDRLLNDDFGSASNATKIRGGPDWVHSLKEKYQIEATAAGATERTVLMGYMLRSLLEDRFKLKLHRDTEEVEMLAMTVGKGGLKLKPMNPGDCNPDGDFMAVGPDVKPSCGVLNMGGADGGAKVRWTFGGFQLSSLASRISSQLKVHVIDRTNVTDKFVFRFDFPRDPDPLVTETGIFAAVEEQIGLKLERVKGPRGFIVIDAIERPTPDGPMVIVPARAQGARQRPR
jgi:uncharacterized protein (TIGR03435 family)